MSIHKRAEIWLNMKKLHISKILNFVLLDELINQKESANRSIGMQYKVLTVTLLYLHS